MRTQCSLKREFFSELRVHKANYESKNEVKLHWRVVEAK